MPYPDQHPRSRNQGQPQERVIGFSGNNKLYGLDVADSARRSSDAEIIAAVRLAVERVANRRRGLGPSGSDR
jgi:hypothetical protein